MKAFCLNVRLHIKIELRSCHSIIWCLNEQQRRTGASFDSMQNIFTQPDQVILSLTWMIMKTVLCSSTDGILHIAKRVTFIFDGFMWITVGMPINRLSFQTIFSALSLSLSLSRSLCLFFSLFLSLYLFLSVCLSSLFPSSHRPTLSCPIGLLAIFLSSFFLLSRSIHAKPLQCVSTNDFSSLTNLLHVE